MQAVDTSVCSRRNEICTSGKWMEGTILKPRTGSSSAPVTNCSTLPTETWSLRPPVTEHVTCIIKENILERDYRNGENLYRRLKLSSMRGPWVKSLTRFLNWGKTEGSYVLSVTCMESLSFRLWYLVLIIGFSIVNHYAYIFSSKRIEVKQFFFVNVIKTL